MPAFLLRNLCRGQTLCPVLSRAHQTSPMLPCVVCSVPQYKECWVRFFFLLLCMFPVLHTHTHSPRTSLFPKKRLPLQVNLSSAWLTAGSAWTVAGGHYSSILMLFCSQLLCFLTWFLPLFFSFCLFCLFSFLELRLFLMCEYHIVTQMEGFC